MPKPIPLSVRRACLRLYADGTLASKIARRHSIRAKTVHVWAKAAGVARNTPLTDEELDAKIAMQAAAVRATAGPTSKKKKQNQAARYGPLPETRESAIKSFKSLGDPDEYKEAISEHFNQVTDEMHRAESPEGQVKALTTGLLLVQLKSMIDTPPPVLNWADGERVIRMLRLTLGMDKDTSVNNQGIDLRIVNARVDRRKVIEAK